MKGLIFIVLCLFQIMMDPILCKCNDVFGKILMIFHHLLSVGILFGSICFGFHEFHLCFTLVAFALHIILKGCFLTKINNQICGFPDNTTLVDITNHINIRHHVAVMLILLYDIIHVYS